MWVWCTRTLSSSSSWPLSPARYSEMFSGAYYEEWKLREGMPLISCGKQGRDGNALFSGGRWKQHPPARFPIPAQIQQLVRVLHPPPVGTQPPKWVSMLAVKDTAREHSQLREFAGPSMFACVSTVVICLRDHSRGDSPMGHEESCSRHHLPLHQAGSTHLSHPLLHLKKGQLRGNHSKRNPASTDLPPHLGKALSICSRNAEVRRTGRASTSEPLKPLFHREANTFF
eukprot:1160536-Pelagomonas_calceolata.AAC.5